MIQPAVCATVGASTTAELRRNRDAVDGADLVELRLDGVEDIDVAGALEGRRLPVLVTCRPRWEGGSFDGSEEERRRLLEIARQGGAEYVDVEWRAGFDALVRSNHGRGIVLSMHDFDGLPGDLATRVAAMRATGAEVVKVAVRASSLNDCVRLLAMRDAAPALVLVGMGPAGLVTRALAARFRSRWTYAGARAEVGQLPLEQLLGEFRFRRITPQTDLYGVIGRPIGHSVSPAIHNAAFGTKGLDAVYLPLEATDAEDFRLFGEAFGVRGASVTAPFKQAFLDLVAEPDPGVRRIGALNTLRWTDRGWLGRNTDVSGFLAPLDARCVELDRLRVAIMGTGGAARAVACALGERRAMVTVHGRDPERAARVAALANGRGAPWLPPAGSWDLLVNATPIGTHPQTESSPLEPTALDGRIVYDLVYNPERTRLLRDAEAAGCQTIGGLEMLVAQAVGQFEWWTDEQAPRDAMQEAARARLHRMASITNRTGGQP